MTSPSLKTQAEIQTLRQQVETMQVLLKQMRGVTDDLISGQDQVKNELKNLERSHEATQQLFQTQLLDQILPEQDELVPHYVEINKQLRLVGADINLLKTTRQPETLNQRIDKAGDRLTLLLTYCDALLAS
ncbi:hypothetical protein Syn7502_02402 [Synechococcus sp. PCC 7502]|uniref:heterocyst frequency control protein PatD n=1 Tax=Synechococcus sp. PCC 7502 TaxID=1173263 RepID=UPI00029F8B29|nr:heterocyst frequency control protein PatD [Synechococcus sp. PCC 7502]AFY74387.1 hypothetical protein Syn7502_02402 [Synechococcus sp. PCC 7502]